MGGGGLLLAAIRHGKRKVLDRYFDNITVDRVESEQEGWSRINDKPQLWSE